MTIHTKPKPAKKMGDRPDDVLSDAIDLIRSVYMSLESDLFDPRWNHSLSALLGKSLGKLDRVFEVLSDGVQSTWDPATPKGKMVIPEFAPEAKP